MEPTIKNIVLSLFAITVLLSCNNEATLQRYFVDNQEAGNFTAIDLPVSMVNLDASQLTKDQKEAYKSVKRLNFLGYKINETEPETLNTELSKVRNILKNEKYTDLMEFSDKGAKVTVKYIGTDDEADEVIVFGSSKDVGFGIVRILGNNMSPDKMVSLAKAIKSSDMDESKLQGIADFFK